MESQNGSCDVWHHLGQYDVRWFNKLSKVLGTPNHPFCSLCNLYYTYFSCRSFKASYWISFWWSWARKLSLNRTIDFLFTPYGSYFQQWTFATFYWLYSLFRGLQVQILKTNWHYAQKLFLLNLQHNFPYTFGPNIDFECFERSFREKYWRLAKDGGGKSCEQ